MQATQEEPRHEPTLCIWTIRGYGNGAVLRIGRPRPLVHSGLRCLVRARLNLWIPSGRMAFRSGRGSLVDHCSPEMVD